MNRLALVALFLLAACASGRAQTAPLVGTTLRTTDTTASSVRVGCTQSGTCTGGVVAGPVDVASVTSAGFIGIANNVPGVTTMRLYNNAGTLTWNGVVLATGASLSGTTGKLAKFTAANAVGDSICTESGTTLTCVNTLAATTGTFTNVAGTLSTASQPSITGVGTITTGVWSGTIVGLAKGGTGVDLSGTGGTSQFLRQNTVGGTVTVVRPAISDLSDGTNVALLNASNTFTRATATSNEINLINTTSGTTALAFLTIGAGTAQGFLSTYSQGWTTSGSTIASGTRLANFSGGGLALASVNAAGSVGLYTGAGGSLRWGVNAAGDWTFGASHIADSSGTPTYLSGFGGSAALDGTDYAFKIVPGGVNAGGAVTFGHTWTAFPVCVAMTPDGATPSLTMSITSSVLSFGYTNTPTTILVLCRGY